MQKRDATKEKLARLVGNAWNVRTRSRTIFCECVCVYTYLYVCMFASGKHCALRKSKRRATEAILITRVPRESSVMNLKSQDCTRLAQPHTSFEIVNKRNKAPHLMHGWRVMCPRPDEECQHNDMRYALHVFLIPQLGSHVNHPKAIVNKQTVVKLVSYYAFITDKYEDERDDRLEPRENVAEKEFFRTFLSDFFLERDGRPIEWDIGNFIHGCQQRRTKLEHRTSRRFSNGGCKPCISFFPFNKGMRNDLGKAGRPKKILTFETCAFDVLIQTKLILSSSQNPHLDFARDADGREIIDEYQPHVNQADNAPNE
ncbi:hypothetical protein G5I_07942 [Acromyrmex echinatior]|uniref:Uncharacterized protein n=1 Tax=Acromyrmex echinatior TaxID=103372 RepID=F4WQ06_ACREC|nr:hypothetical protein G5I_07942 [Acromyrmex echinatior]